MTEAEWLKASEPERMLRFLDGKISDRKSRLFAIACCRHILHLADDVRVKDVLEVAERVAEGDISALGDIHDVAQKKVFDALNEAEQGSVSRLVAKAAIHASFHAWVGTSISLVVAKDTRDAKFIADGIRRRAHACHQAKLARDIFGNPFRSTSMSFHWSTSDVHAIAEGVYTDRAFDRMPILADALQDAGCNNEDILSHCRGAGPHVRGCWVVDLVLGKK